MTPRVWDLGCVCVEQSTPLMNTSEVFIRTDSALCKGVCVCESERYNMLLISPCMALLSLCLSRSTSKLVRVVGQGLLSASTRALGHSPFPWTCPLIVPLSCRLDTATMMHSLDLIRVYRLEDYLLDHVEYHSYILIWMPKWWWTEGKIWWGGADLMENVSQQLSSVGNR